MEHISIPVGRHSQHSSIVQGATRSIPIVLCCRVHWNDIHTSLARSVTALLREPYNLNNAANALSTNCAVAPHKAVVGVWHTTALFGDPTVWSYISGQRSTSNHYTPGH